MAKDIADGLELSEFISLTLVEIVKGVEGARRRVAEIETNAEVCPTGLYYQRQSAPGPYKPGRGFVQEVAFDVAVTVSKGQSSAKAGEARLNISVPIVSAWLPGVEAGGQSETEHRDERSEVSRVTFRVPLLLPSELHEWEGNKRGHPDSLASG